MSDSSIFKANPPSTHNRPGSPATPAADLPAVPRYEILDRIAAGGMGVVYRADDTVLGREVAVKVLSDRLGPDPDAARRFADEARIAAQLQHPSVPPVHDLGTLPDGRPFLAMKLVKGQTLDALLDARPDPAHDRGRFVAVFEQVCQAVGYAHAHNVIHRDLKPSNVMVGAFAEVQVMDWGLAKVLTPRPGEPDFDPEATTGTAIVSQRDSDGSETQAGTVLGTLAFMPPEQALGAIAKVDRRSDVFGLGAILAVILTGRPPFQEGSRETLRLRSAQGRLDDCFARLDACGAEPELVALCKRCLNPDSAGRPTDGGEVAAAVAGLRQAADERARQAELDRVRAEGDLRAAEAKATEQGKRRRVQLALMAAVGLILLGGGAFGWWHNEQARAEQQRLVRNAEAAVALLDQCEEALRAGDAARAAMALAAAEKRLAEGGADELVVRLERYRADLAVLEGLDEVDQFRWTTEANLYSGPPQVATRYFAVLAPFGIDPDQTSAGEAAGRVVASAVRDRLIAALDRLLRELKIPWERQLLGEEKLAWVREVLRVADPDDSYRDAVRDAVLTNDLATIAALASQPEAVNQAPGFAAFLGESGAVGVERRRELLTAALRQRPGTLGLLMTLGRTYPRNQKSGAEERVRWFQAAVEVAPENMNAVARYNLGRALKDKGDLDGAIAQYKEVLRLVPKSENAHLSLGIAVGDKGDVDGSIAEYKEALRLDPTMTQAHINLGNALRAKGDLDGAIAAYKEALRLDAENASAHNGLGIAVGETGDVDGSIAEYKEALRIDPKSVQAHINLGNARRAKGDLDGAIAEYQEAIRLDPKHGGAQANLAAVERMRKLLPRLPDILTGRAEPKTPAEACEFAYLCAQPFQKRYAAAAGMYQKAFAADARLAEDPLASHRYRAARCAAMVAAGLGVDAPDLKPDERSALRAKALAWLAADLVLWQKQVATKTPADRKTAAGKLSHWLNHSDLAAMRPGARRESWTPEETAAWDMLWSDVRDTLAEAKKPPAQTAPPDR